MIENLFQAKAFLEAEWREMSAKFYHNVPTGTFLKSAPVKTGKQLRAAWWHIRCAIDIGILSTCAKFNIMPSDTGEDWVYIVISDLGNPETSSIWVDENGRMCQRYATTEELLRSELKFS